MKKILALALALSATVLLASPTKDGIAKCGIMDGGCQCCAGERPQCDTSKLPPRLAALGLSDDQKVQVQKIREDGKTFRAQQHDKIKAVLTPEQQKKFEETSKTCSKKEVKMKTKTPAAGMGCKSCDKK